MSNALRVWLIDDDEDDSFFFQTALEDIDYPVEFSTFRDSEVAVSILNSDKTQVPDLLFLDWNMPKLTGRDCLVIIRQCPHLKKLPVIVYTTSKSSIDKELAKKLGASFFLTKPSTFSDLSKKLNKLFTQDWTITSI